MNEPKPRKVRSFIKLLSASMIAGMFMVSIATWSFAQTIANPLPKPTVTKGAKSSKKFSATPVFPKSSKRATGRTLKKSSQWKPGDPIKEIPRQLTHPKPTGDRTPVKPPRKTGDVLMEKQSRALKMRSPKALSAPIVNRGGQGFSGVNPPDTVGDVGRNFYIQMINGSDGARFVIYDKVGNVVTGPTDLDSLGDGVCANGNGDPIVLYDSLADRWLLSEFAPRGDKTLCVYVSITDDPTIGGWFAYQFQANRFPDYPKYAVWPDAYYLASNEASPTVYAFDRIAMLAGQPATHQSFSASSLGGFQFQALQPGDLDGKLEPPAGAPGYFIRHKDDESHNPTNNDPSSDFLEIFEFHVDFTNDINSTFTGPFSIPISEMDSDLCGLSSFSCFEQPSGLNPLDPLREVVMWRVQYRNFGNHETLVGNMVTDVDGNNHGGIRWFELRKTPDNDTWQLFQEGTYAPDQHNRWMGSIAMDRAGNIALGFSVGSSTLSAGLRYTGRLKNDPTGTMPQTEHVLVNGQNSSASVRWGDYKSLNVDPADGCTFWLTGGFTNNGRWNTQIGSFSYQECLRPVIVEPLPVPVPVPTLPCPDPSPDPGSPFTPGVPLSQGAFEAMLNWKPGNRAPVTPACLDPDLVTNPFPPRPVPVPIPPRPDPAPPFTPGVPLSQSAFEAMLNWKPGN